VCPSQAEHALVGCPSITHWSSAGVRSGTRSVGFSIGLTKRGGDEIPVRISQRAPGSGLSSKQCRILCDGIESLARDRCGRRCCRPRPARQFVWCLVRRLSQVASVGGFAASFVPTCIAWSSLPFTVRRSVRVERRDKRTANSVERCDGARNRCVARSIFKALGFWAAVRDVSPETRYARCWFHKVSNVLSALPTSQHSSAKKLLGDIRDAANKSAVVTAIDAFTKEFGVKWPKAVAKIVDDTQELLAFFDFPAEHRIHLKITNPIESTFSTVRLRTKVTKGPGSKAAGLAMAFKLIDAAQDCWRKINAPALVPLVRAGAVFHEGQLIENKPASQEAAA
jgi:Transposase, Mutator family